MQVASMCACGFYVYLVLTNWGRMAHICVSKLTIIGSDNGLSPGRRQAIIWTNARILLIGPLGTNFSEILLDIHTFPFKKMHLKMSSGKCRPFCFGLNVLIHRHTNKGLPFCRRFILSQTSLKFFIRVDFMTLLWRHNGRDSVSNHQPHDCLLNRLFRRRSKQTSKLRVTGLCTNGQ